MAHKDKGLKSRTPKDFKPGTAKEPFIPARMPPDEHAKDVTPPLIALIAAPKKRRWWQFWQQRQEA